METRTLMFESIDRLAGRTGQKELCEAIKKLYDACFESHKDRTTGGNFGGKTIRDQNNYDNDWGTYRETKTAPETQRRYGFTKDGVKGMGVSGKFGSAWDIKDDGRNTTGANSGVSKFGRAVMKAGEKRFFDPKKVLERDELDGEDIEAPDNTGEYWDDPRFIKSYSAYASPDYEETIETISPAFDRVDDAKGVDNVLNDGGIAYSITSDADPLGDTHPVSEKYYDIDRDMIDYCEQLDSDNDEDDGDEAWERAGYVSGDMFGESIDKLAKVTGQKDLCEAVKKLYKACFEAEDDIDYEAVAAKKETEKLFAHAEGTKSVMLDQLEELLDNLGCAIINSKDSSDEDNLPSVDVEYVYSFDEDTEDTMTGSVGITCGFDGTLTFDIRDEYHQNLKDYICASQGAPLGYSKKYSSADTDQLFADIENDIRKITQQDYASRNVD